MRDATPVHASRVELPHRMGQFFHRRHVPLVIPHYLLLSVARATHFAPGKEAKTCTILFGGSFVRSFQIVLQNCSHRFPSVFLKNFTRLMKLVKEKDEIECVEEFDDVETKGDYFFALL